MGVTCRRLPPGMRGTISSCVTDRRAGQGMTDRIKRRQRDRDEEQYLTRCAQKRQDEADCSHHLAANSSRGARRRLRHRMHLICQRRPTSPMNVDSVLESQWALKLTTLY